MVARLPIMADHVVAPVSQDTDTWLLLAIAAIAFLVLVVVLARAASNKRTTESQATIVK